jgi:hypothetical protein
MTAVEQPEVVHRDVLEQQERFRQAQRDAVGEALDMPIADARARLEQLAADEQRWLTEQRQLLRELARQGRSTMHAGEVLADTQRQLASVTDGHGRGWSL